jgi:hypothetical protein
MTAQQVSGGFEILSIASKPDGSVCDLLVSTYDRHVIALQITDERFSARFASQRSGIIPRTVAFIDNARDFRVFGLHDGNMYVHAANGCRRISLVADTLSPIREIVY